MTHVLLLASIGSALVAGPPAGGSALKPPAPSSECLNDGARFARDAPKAEAKSLGELPAGSLVLTVLRQENGCVKPVVVREGFGLEGSARTDRRQPGTPPRR